ncbi:PIN domain-containing protein [Gordonia sp. ABSL11-1]|uniref:TA system VapC family ribonuclease toxin n=1 Tax=Gordonia sp. ABSL11-1 TaxID=3053924 RepID=UPI00257477A2|nr:TA system VapC family ribonuclease toxin [Gordonia sp. ABSL11-1]MDL9948009.1 PIN domain-containing protein [Gordonia sp. ABSL11-1]
MSETDLPDVNVLVALVHPGHVHHQPAQEWFADVVRFATTPITEAGLMRVALNRTVMGRAVRGGDAVATLRSLRAHDRATFLADDSSLADAAIDLAGLVGFRQVTDLHLVNLAARSGARLVTFDTKIEPVLGPSDRRLVLTLS